MHRTFKMATSVVDNNLKKMKPHQVTQQDVRERTYLGQDRRDRAAGETNVSSTSMKRQIDVSGRTRGLDQTNHRPWSSRHPMSLHPSTTPIPYCLSPCVLHLLKILCIWLSVPSWMPHFPTMPFLWVFPLLFFETAHVFRKITISQDISQ